MSQDQPDAASKRTRTGIIWSCVGLAAVIVLVVVVARGVGGSSAESDAPTEPADFVAVKLPYDAGSGHALDPSRAGLAGPDFSLSFTKLAITDTLDTGEYGQDEVGAAAGHEFLVLTANQTPAADEPDDADSVSASITVAGRSRSVDLTAVVGSGLEISVPKGGTAILRIKDQGRTQSLDLRTGRRGADAIAGYYGDHRLKWTGGDYSESGTSTYAGCHRVTDAMIDIDAHSTVLLPWGPGVGWAKPGRAWLAFAYTMPPNSGTTLPDYHHVMDMPASCATAPDLAWNLAGSVSLRDAGAEEAPARVVEDDAEGQLVFDVPASLTSATLVVHPAFSLGDQSGRAGTVDWNSPPPTRQIALSAPAGR